MTLNIMSFGFKYGVPREADIVYDVRCLPNPFYIPELKGKNGNDHEVSDYVMQFEESQKLLEQDVYKRQVLGIMLIWRSTPQRRKNYTTFKEGPMISVALLAVLRK